MDLTWLDTPLITLGDMRLNTFNIVFSSLSLFIGLWIAKYVRKLILNKIGSKPGLDKSTIYTVATLSYYVITVLSVLVAFSVLGFDITNLAIVAGALSVGIGFGLQDVAKNFISGILLLFDRSIKVGDFIELPSSGLRGVVQQIRVRSTIVQTADELDVIVPNSSFLSDQVINWTMSSASLRLHIPLSVAYGSDVEKLRTIMLDLATKLPHVIQDEPNHKPNIWFTAMDDSSLNFELLVWVKDDAVFNSFRTKSELTFAVHKAILDNGYVIPFPQRDLHIKSMSQASSPLENK